VCAAELVHSWSTLVREGGMSHVSSLAEEVGWSRRHLTQQFRAEFGLTSKVAGRVLRFERARDLVSRRHGQRLADVAAGCGYADQAHMSREWQALAGTTPGAWRTDEQFPILQDSPAPGGARLSA